MTGIQPRLHRLFIRCLVAAAVAWLPLLILSLMAGQAYGDAVARPLLSDLSVLVRFLVGLPLLLFAGAMIRTKLHRVIEYVGASDMLTGPDREAFQRAASCHERWFGARVPKVVCAVLALTASWLTLIGMLGDGVVSWFSDGAGQYSGLTAAGWWFIAVSFTMWHYVALLRFWQFVNWWIFLARLARLHLELVPTHPDRCGGIGILEMGQLSFTALVAAFASILAASLAESLLAGSLQLPAAVPYILVFALICIVVILAPLLGFVPSLVRAKREGLVTYGDLGEGLFRAFDQKWSGLSSADQRALLGNVDPSSLADYGYCYEVVDDMRILPLSLDGFKSVGIAVILPFVPLVLIHHSVIEVLQRLLGIGS